MIGGLLAWDVMASGGMRNQNVSAAVRTQSVVTVGGGGYEEVEGMQNSRVIPQQNAKPKL